MQIQSLGRGKRTNEGLPRLLMFMGFPQVKYILQV